MSSADAYRESKNTPHKQLSFYQILANLFAIIGAIRNKPVKKGDPNWAKNTNPIYFDLFAGPGVNKAGNPGSPLIFLEVARLQNYLIESHFYEKDPVSVASLNRCIDNFVDYPKNVQCVVHPECNQHVDKVLMGYSAKESSLWRFGIAYADPSDADLNAALYPLQRIAATYPRVDLVLNYAAASWKRQKELHHYRNLLQYLVETGKSKWFIRKPIDRFQWTMLMGTNFLSFSADEKRYWFDVDSAEGDALLKKVAFTREELDGSDSNEDLLSQLPLWGK